MTDETSGAALGVAPPVEPPDGGPPTTGGSGDGAGDGARPPRYTFGDGVRFVLRGIGQTLITGGVVVLLFVVYEVYVTNYFAHREQRRVHTALEQQWATGTDVLTLPQGQLSKLDGKGIANLYIPRFGRDYAWTIVEGTSDADLEKGPGHYAGTQLPGQTGDFAVAGHRVGKGEPFLNLDQIKAGDAIVVETETTWYVYCVIGAGAPLNTSCGPTRAGAQLSNRDANQVPGREIVSPSDGEVIDPVPSDPNATLPYRTAYMTMTTCHPKFTANQRMIVHAVLDVAMTIPKPSTGPRTFSSAVPAQILALYTQVGT